MIEKNNENSSKSNSCKLLEEDDMEIPNVKLLYRSPTNPERDKSSGVSSDDETTSSSLVPIPDNLKKLRKSKWTAANAGDYSEVDSTYVSGNFGKTRGTVVNCLEELRKKYTLRNETSVTLKMNSANLMLDDILSSNNLYKSSNSSHPPNFLKKEEFRQKTDVESDISTNGKLETSVSQIQPCAHFVDHSHLPVALDCYSPPCPCHYSHVKHLHTVEEKAPYSPKRDLDSNQRKKTFMEKFQDLQLKYRIQTAYRNLQKSRNPFTKSRKDSKTNNVQGIPVTGCHGDEGTVNESACKCEHHKHYPRKMILDLIESSEISPFDLPSIEREEYHCTCVDERKCNCPEVIPTCVCIQHFQVSSENIKKNSPRSEVPSGTTEYVEASKPVFPAPKNNDNGFNLLVKKEAESTEDKRQKKDVKNFRGGWKHCSKEKNIIKRTDIYYFDHGNSAYYQTTDNHPMRYTECLVERTDEYATKFWAEFFGTIEIGVAFLISFILQLYRFLFTSIIRSLTVGLLQVFSDYLFKPLLTILFNGIIQPCLILAYNITTSVRDLCRPISEIFGFFAKEVASILRSCRLVEVNRDTQSSCHCENKV